ncbi:hypothetical protein MAPG_04567 [Magnaporthiopsis poae ATCC 64411]|uniref:Uncharacterized protein n=1 Tax=Magnaporthiopsis poae (strain ATCC 64411 / 73-15) TaxID=644358 RepID=A0A0C4DX29_MAGP6|nr:hypothetical protein MAPG_04567 [Magnaporthiopsis poae ATCC 64411]
MVETRAGSLRRAKQAPVYFPNGCPNEILQLVVKEGALSKRDLKSLRLVCKKWRDQVTPVLFDTVICSTLWADRNKFLSIAGSPELAGSVRTLRWLDLPPVVLNDIESMSLPENARDDYRWLRQELVEALNDPINHMFWLEPPENGPGLYASSKLNFVVPFTLALHSMPKLTRVEVTPMPRDRVVWKSPGGYEFTSYNLRSFHPHYIEDSYINDGAGAEFATRAIEAIGKVAGPPGTGPDGIVPTLVWEENEYPSFGRLAYGLEDCGGGLQYVQELSLSLANSREPPTLLPLVTQEWQTMKDDLTSLSEELFKARYLRKLCLDWKAWAFRDHVQYTPLEYLMRQGAGQVAVWPCLEVLIIKNYEQHADLSAFLVNMLKSHGGGIRTLRLENCKTTVQIMRALVQDDVPRVEEFVVIEDGVVVYKGETKGFTNFSGFADLPFKLPQSDDFYVRDHRCDPFMNEGSCSLLHHALDDPDDGNGWAEKGGKEDEEEEAEFVRVLDDLVTAGQFASWDTRFPDSDYDEEKEGRRDDDGDVVMEDVPAAEPEDGDEKEEGSEGDDASDEDDDDDEDDPGRRYRTAPYWAYRPYKSRAFKGAVYWRVPADYPFARPTTIWILTRWRKGALIDEPLFTWEAPEEHYEDWDESKGDRAEPTPLNWELTVLAYGAKGFHDLATRYAQELGDGGIPPFPRVRHKDNHIPVPVRLDPATRQYDFVMPEDPTLGGFFIDCDLLNALSPEFYEEALEGRRDWEREQEDPSTPWWEE